MKNFIVNAIGVVLLYLAIVALLAIPSFIHSRHCDGCDWFWCHNYNGKGSL